MGKSDSGSSRSSSSSSNSNMNFKQKDVPSEKILKQSMQNKKFLKKTSAATTSMNIQMHDKQQIHRQQYIQLKSQKKNMNLSQTAPSKSDKNKMNKTMPSLMSKKVVSNLTASTKKTKAK